MPLNDKQIRPFLINFLNSSVNKPQKVMEELSVCYGDAIADVVAIYNILHCFEIKGETDSIHRIQHQGQFYNKSFLKITLVTTKNHLNSALKLTPDYWGILLAANSNHGAVFKKIRPPKKNPEFSKEEALHTLWKDELLDISKKKDIPVKAKMSKKVISHILSENLSDNFVAKTISLSIQKRIYNSKPSYI
jgi:conserved hypothetical protein